MQSRSTFESFETIYFRTNNGDHRYVLADDVDIIVKVAASPKNRYDNCSFQRPPRDCSYCQNPQA